MHLPFSSRHDGGEDMLCSRDIPRGRRRDLDLLFSESRMIFFSFHGLGVVVSDLSARRPSGATAKHLVAQRGRQLNSQRILSVR